MNDDTISRKAAIEIIKKEIIAYKLSLESPSLNREEKEILRNRKAQAIEDVVAIEALPSAEPQWIPVTERLPEKEDMYLVTCFNGRPRLDVAWFYIDEKGSGYFSCDLGDFDSVTAWMMPLPKPYKGGEEEE